MNFSVTKNAKNAKIDFLTTFKLMSYDNLKLDPQLM
jgi:hypothetical protein